MWQKQKPDARLMQEKDYLKELSYLKKTLQRQ